jgi:hypothetical protein
MQGGTCPPPSWSPYLMIAIVPAFLLFTWCYISQVNEKKESHNGPNCGDCNHATHHAGHTCEVPTPNRHVICQCAVQCGQDYRLSQPELTHCGRPCRRKFPGGKCSCTQCTCSRCAPQIVTSLALPIRLCSPT